MNLYKLAIGGLNAAQAGIATTAHNINNATTTGFNRQRVMTSTAGAQATANGFIGRGVQVDTISRSYDSFLYRQLVGAQGQGAQLQTQVDQVSQVNNLFADRTVGISPALANFFSSVNAVASKPADPAARQDMIGKANSLVTQINSAYEQLQTQRIGLNEQITTTVAQTNSYLERISDLNKQITLARASAGGQSPNDLLDQRDQAISELNQLVGVTTYEQGDSINISLSNGQALLSGNQIYKLQAVPSSSDVTRTVVAFSLPAGSGGKTIAVEMDDSQVTGGKLGGLTKFRTENLDRTQSQLGQMAVGMALAFNEVHKLGFDLDGVQGGDFFKVPTPQVVRNSDNAGNGVFAAAFDTASEVTSKDYEITYKNGDYLVTSKPDGALVAQRSAADTTEWDLSDKIGVKLTVPPATATIPQNGDSWSLNPTRAAGGELALLVTDPSKIAAAATQDGNADGGNALKLAELQNKKVLGGGSMSVNESFSQLVNTVGVQTQQVLSAAKAQANLIIQKTAAQQSVSGVNLNEEYVNLSQYQEQYQASARIIDVASSMFDTLLGLRG